MTGLNPTTFSAVVLPTQVVNFIEVPGMDPSPLWFPELEDYLYTENDYVTNYATVSNFAGKDSVYTENNFKIITATNIQERGPNDAAKGNISIEDGNNLPVKNSVTEDILYDQIVQLEEFDGEVIQKCSNTLENSFTKGIAMEVIDSGKQATLEESGNMPGKLKENSAVVSSSKLQDTPIPKSPKSSRKATDCRRRREKANEREKHRIVVLKNAMNVLKNAIPAARGKTKITKLEVLKLAQDYINSLRAQLMEEPAGDPSSQFESLLRLHFD